MAKQVYKKYNLSNLIKLAKNGDKKALETIIRNEQKHIFAIFSHLTDKKNDISDLTQETLLKIAKNLYQLKNPENFQQWVNKIITNVYRDFTRKKQVDFIEINEEKLNEIKDKLGCEPGEKCLFIEIEDIIKSALLTLPQALRLSIVLREFEGLSYEDISKLTHTTLGTVKSRIARARFKLQEELKDFI